MSVSDDFKRILEQSEDWSDWRKETFEKSNKIILEKMKERYLIPSKPQNKPVRVEYSDLVKQTTTKDGKTKFTFDVGILSDSPIGCLTVPDDKWDEFRQICADLGIEIVGD